MHKLGSLILLCTISIFTFVLFSNFALATAAGESCSPAGSHACGSDGNTQFYCYTCSQADLTIHTYCKNNHIAGDTIWQFSQYCSTSNRKCVNGQCNAICGDGVCGTYETYADCPGYTDCPAPLCSDGQQITSRCKCGGTEYTSGYCCNGAYKSTACDGQTTCANGAIPGNGACMCNGVTYNLGYCCNGVYSTSAPCSTNAPQCSEGAVPSSGCTCAGYAYISGYCCYSYLGNTKNLVWAGTNPCTQTCASLGGYCCSGSTSNCVGYWSSQWATDCQGYVCCIGTCTGTCYGTNCPSQSCLEGQITSRCKCGGTEYTSGYCCNGAYKSTACSGATAIPGAGAPEPSNDEPSVWAQVDIATGQILTTAMCTRSVCGINGEYHGYVPPPTYATGSVWWPTSKRYIWQLQGQAGYTSGTFDFNTYIFTVSGGTIYNGVFTPTAPPAPNITSNLTCPACSSPSEWSPSCLNNQQTRTNYKCDASTNYMCQPYMQTKTCVVEAPPSVTPPSPATPPVSAPSASGEIPSVTPTTLPIGKIKEKVSEMTEQLEKAKANVSEEVKAKIEVSQNKSTVIFKEIESFENETAKRDIVYALRWLVGMVAEQEKKDAEFMSQRALGLKEVANSLKNVSESITETNKEIVVQQAQNLENQAKELEKMAKEKRENAGGIVTWFLKLFGITI